jgi:hypothetical protein
MMLLTSDPPLRPTEDELRHAKISDHHFRIFADRESIYIFNNKVFTRHGHAIFDARDGYFLMRFIWAGNLKGVLAVEAGQEVRTGRRPRWGYVLNATAIRMTGRCKTGFDPFRGQAG